MLGTYFNIDEYSFKLDNYCPVCDLQAFIKAIQVIPIGTVFNITANEPIVVGRKIYDSRSAECYIVKASCPICTREFAALYKRGIDMIPTKKSLEFIFYLPQRVGSVTVPDSIEEISPRFVSIYNQAVNAMLLGLNELSGFGFRKALEFLVKDYLITKASESERDKIASLGLMKAIRLIDDQDINELMDGIRHSGNDETHYQRKYDFDTKEIVEFIELVISLLDIRVRSETSRVRIKEALEKAKGT